MEPNLIGRILVWFERLSGILFGLVTVLIVVSSIGRYLLAHPVPDAFDLSRLLLGIAIVWGFASVAYMGTHIKVDILVGVLPPKFAKWINAFAWSILLLFTGLLVWKMWGRVINTYHSGDTTMELRLKHWPFFLAIWLGFVAAFVATALRLWLIISRNAGLGDFEAIETDVAKNDE